MYFDLFIVKTPTMEHPNQGTVLKLRFYGNIHLVCRENFASVLNKWSLSKNFHDYSTFNVHERCKTSNSLPIFIARSTSFMFDSMEELSITVADCSVQLKRWLLSLLAFIKLFLNYLKSSSDDVSNVLILDSFSSTVYVILSSAYLQYLDLQGSKEGCINVYWRVLDDEAWKIFPELIFWSQHSFHSLGVLLCCYFFHLCLQYFSSLFYAEIFVPFLSYFFSQCTVFYHDSFTFYFIVSAPHLSYPNITQYSQQYLQPQTLQCLFDYHNFTLTL